MPGFLEQFSADFGGITNPEHLDPEWAESIAWADMADSCDRPALDELRLAQVARAARMQGEIRVRRRAGLQPEDSSSEDGAASLSLERNGNLVILPRVVAEAFVGQAS